MHLVWTLREKIKCIWRTPRETIANIQEHHPLLPGGFEGRKEGRSGLHFWTCLPRKCSIPCRQEAQIALGTSQVPGQHCPPSWEQSCNPSVPFLSGSHVLLPRSSPVCLMEADPSVFSPDRIHLQGEREDMPFSTQMGHAWLDFRIYQEFDPIPLSLPPHKVLSLHPTPPHLSSCEARVSSETHFPLSWINPFFKKISA
ncbi:hypothetical protein L345_13584, partial [Ophiophagus hannah]